jgi:phosphatidylserine/phosphatidylglycerophosphate/cardiolipin synthase-like enzyme
MRNKPPLALVVLLALSCGAALWAGQGGALPAPFAEPAASAPASDFSTAQTGPERIRVLFSPRGGCTEAIVAAIGAARSSVDVQAYSFTSAPIAKAVADAHARGLRVRVVLDRSQRGERYSSATFLRNHRVPVWIDDEHAIAHNKVILIDGDTVLTGSFNFSKAAEERNAENLLIIEGRPELASAYRANFEEHLGHAKPYTGPTRR